jgi:1-phosphofructokinase
MRLCHDALCGAVGNRFGAMPDRPRVTIFAPDPLLSVAVEARGREDELHLHAGGQGVWVARMAAEMGATPVLCSFLGGETGELLLPLLTRIRGELRITPTAGSSGSYVVDRRHGERNLLASSLRPALHRHEIDDLVSATVAAALGSSLLVLCNPYPAEGLPDEVYSRISTDAKRAGIPVLVDLSSPRLDRTLASCPNLVKLNDWELAEYVNGPVDGPLLLEAACALLDAGALTVAVTRADAPILVVSEHFEPLEIVPPPFTSGYREGCGDAMMGAVAAAWARGVSPRQSLMLGAAAGSVNFLRRGLGSGRRATIEELATTIVTRAASVEISTG